MDLNNVINTYKVILSNAYTTSKNDKRKNVVDKLIGLFIKNPETKSEGLNFLESLDTETFYNLLSAWDIGRSVLTAPDCLNDDIRINGGKTNLMKENVKTLKNNLPIQYEAAIYFKDKDCIFVKQCLIAFQKEFI
ncbi:MAG: hypothetical protein ACTH2I_10155 [Staphylococcus equorum]|uniref:hypothetical protein n=1 Tax=Staphylococcus equorum TaxID=246432 RepID=UPI000267DF0F|nr:hypothetical protein [Staphylococcus equorum]MDK9842614.1 hypothetical protein [Staphylococcus equorum]MDK9859335.1 hypothetical protein [Staphylococcus equorum]MDN5638325.1 hypothetical protein [Staphylococcus equorum]PNZ07301.1 hypothetical protein CD144_06885 [Staphylococcus equorum subsp. linens]QQT16759.1 hypothetical protein I6J07_07525 [Staphylococcus equorum]